MLRWNSKYHGEPPESTIKVITDASRPTSKEEKIKIEQALQVKKKTRWR